MTPRRRTLLMIGLGVLAVAAGGLFAWRSYHVATGHDVLLRRLPTQDAVVAGVDFDSLRSSGFLRFLLDSKTPQDGEYVEFVRDSGFDYKRDLNYVLASFAPDGEFFFIQGTFDWPRLENYVATQKGTCYQHFCRVAGSTPERKISFFPLQRNVMAMAVATDDTAAARLEKDGPQSDVTFPGEPVWVTFSAGALRHSTSLPGSSRLFASAITDAERVTLTAGASGGTIEARMDAVCRDAQQAGALAGQFQSLTTMLRTAAQREHQSISPDNLAGFLSSGTFHQAGSHVLGHWPVAPALLQNVTGGM